MPLADISGQHIGDTAEAFADLLAPNARLSAIPAPTDATSARPTWSPNADFSIEYQHLNLDGHGYGFDFFRCHTGLSMTFTACWPMSGSASIGTD